jgi:alkanesulfonate monooxygenase SsuD/methylene tetrahydromethanopterin reductase-like flavin-dependent oxidoreductase (luciferase family)
VDISDDDTLAWAAAQGISPLVPAATPTEAAVERLQRYRHLADAAGRRRTEVEPALERHIVVGGASDATTVGGTPDELIDQLRDLGAAGGVTHLIWNRRSPRDGDLFGFASQVQLMLQA